MHYGAQIYAYPHALSAYARRDTSKQTDRQTTDAFCDAWSDRTEWTENHLIIYLHSLCVRVCEFNSLVHVFLLGGRASERGGHHSVIHQSAFFENLSINVGAYLACVTDLLYVRLCDCYVNMFSCCCCCCCGNDIFLFSWISNFEPLTHCIHSLITLLA